MGSQAYVLKLMVNKATNRVVYAEATKSVVDFLFSLTEMPIGSIIKLQVKKEKDGAGTGEGEEKAIVGSFVKIYESLELLNETYFLESYIKPSLLNTEANRSRFYPYENVLVSSFCHQFKTRFGDHYGYVQERVTFIIMDDLSVAPISGISTFKFLLKGGVMDVGALEERVVQLSKDQAFKMLKAALRFSNTVLSDVFLTLPNQRLHR